MSSALIQHLALVSESSKVGMSQLTKVSAALQKQAIRDLEPIWNIAATVDAFERLEDVPLGYWPMIVMDNIGFDGAAGIHLDNDGQPFALITSDSDIDGWSLTASHETLEMLVDPFGDRLVAGDSPKPDQGRVMFLVEVSDPSEAAQFGYSVNGILVSDFYTPRFFDPTVAHGIRYSYTDAITEPRQVLPGGYLSWMDPVTGHWWQEIWFSGSQSRFRDLGPLTAGKLGFRAQIDKITGQETHEAMQPGRSAATAAGLRSSVVHDSTSARAASLRHQIDAIVDRPGRARAASPESTEGRRCPRTARS